MLKSYCTTLVPRNKGFTSTTGDGHVGYEFTFASNTSDHYLHEFKEKIEPWVTVSLLRTTTVSFANPSDSGITLTGVGNTPNLSEVLSKIRAQLEPLETPAAENTGPAIYFKLLHPEAQFPSKAHATDAGYDIRALERAYIEPGKVVLVPTGIGCFIPTGYEFQCRPRSSIFKSTLIVQNSPGTIDSDYRNEIKIIMRNIGDEAVIIPQGERIAQLVLSKLAEHTVHHLGFVQDYPVEGYADRGGGFGSTGKR